jgi:predicted enzyme related to lactoylglutathione lyase
MLTIGNLTVDCADAAGLASFYATLLDRPVDPGASEYFATIGRGTSPVLMFLKVPDRTPGKNSVHLDLHTDALADEITRAVSLGAKHLADFDEYGAVWATFADPEGNVFDIGTGGTA